MGFEPDAMKRLKKSNFVNFIGIKPYLDENEAIVLELVVDDPVLNLNNTLHGGVHASMLDTIVGQTVAQDALCPVATVSLNVFYSAPAVKGSVLTATGTIVQQGYRLATAEGMITDENGTLIAKAIGTLKILRPKTKETSH